MSLPVDSNPASVGDHLFAPHGPWWERCAICGLGAAAHTQSAIVLEGAALPYRCPDCVKLEIDSCPHG